MAVRIGELLLKEERITAAQLEEALEHQKSNGGKLGYNLVKIGFAKDEEIASLLSRQYGVPSINLSQFEIDAGVIKLALPSIIERLAERPRGLVLVTGPTGCGKSTTLAALIDKINIERHAHILTIEDPIDYIHTHKNCLVNQREVLSDTKSFAPALRAALREDPDVVLIGELRDLETIESALRIAETGHLTFATAHTNSAYQTISRIIDVFPHSQQAQVRTQLSLVLEGIMCQTLLPKLNGSGRVVATEVMIPTPAIRNLIREDKIHQLYSVMQAGQEKIGMQTMNQSLATLVKLRRISMDAAVAVSSMPDELRDLVQRGASVVAGAGMSRMRPARGR